MRRLNASTLRSGLACVVATAAVLGLASMIHPSDSSALPTTVTLPPVGSASSAESDQISLGTLNGRDAVAHLFAATPEPLCDVDWDTPLDDATLAEYLKIEGMPQHEGDLEAWPDAFMQVDIGDEW